MKHELTVYTGPMFSSKTSKLLMRLEKYKFQNKNILVFKPKIDTRYSTNNITTHSGWSIEAINISNGEQILKHVLDQNNKMQKFDVIAVDELFMIPGVAETLIQLFCQNFNIVVSTLDISSKLTVFDELEKILPWATTIDKCTAACTICGEDAQYTFKKQTKSKNEKLIEIGGVEKYEPRCFKHHPLIKLL
tara:strand:+ start:1760 stop:2332 length:573 start_codon:yes stop_codon:yes gene_type:complete